MSISVQIHGYIPPTARPPGRRNLYITEAYYCYSILLLTACFANELLCCSCQCRPWELPYWYLLPSPPGISENIMYTVVDKVFAWFITSIFHNRLHTSTWRIQTLFFIYFFSCPEISCYYIHEFFLEKTIGICQPCFTSSLANQIWRLLPLE